MPIENDPFEKYYRESEPDKIEKGIHETTEYLELFLRNLLLGEHNVLKNRYLHIRWSEIKQDIEDEKQDIQNEKQDIEGRKQDIEDLNQDIRQPEEIRHLIEGWGTGLPRLFASCAEMGLPEPKFEEFGDGIKVTIYRAIDSLPGEEKANESNHVNDESNWQSNASNHESNESNESNHKVNYDTEEENIKNSILQEIRENPQISQRTLANKMGVARSTIQRHMNQLEKNAIIKRFGGTRGYWKILDSNGTKGN